MRETTRLDGGVRAGSAGLRDGLETVELVTQLLAGFPFEEFRQGHGFAERQVHRGKLTTWAGRQRAASWRPTASLDTLVRRDGDPSLHVGMEAAIIFDNSGLCQNQAC